MSASFEKRSRFECLNRVLKPRSCGTKMKEIKMEEGHFTIVKSERSADCDHGPCTINTLDNGWSFVTYDNDPKRVSFHAD